MSSVNLDYEELFLKSDYADSCQHTTFNTKRKEIFLIHFNIRSLQKHIDELNSILASFKNQPEIVAISENKIIEGKINPTINLDGFSFIHCDSVARAGGVKNGQRLGHDKFFKHFVNAINALFHTSDFF